MAKKIKNKGGPGSLAISFQNTMACNMIDRNATQFVLDPLQGLTSNEFEQLIECIEPPQYWEPQVLISTRVSPPPANPNFTNGKTLRTYSKAHKTRAKRKRSRAKKKIQSKTEEPLVTTTQVPVQETIIPTSSQEIVCSVCNDTDTVSKAYKAFACFDCRKSYYGIGWRKSELPTVCSNKENNCEITIETRENCSYCRLQKLYSIGFPIIKLEELKTPIRQLDTNNNDNHDDNDNDNHNDDNDNDISTNQPQPEPEICDKSVDMSSNCGTNKGDREISSSDISLVCISGRGECLLDITTKGKCEYCRLRKYMALGLIDSIDCDQQAREAAESTGPSGQKDHGELSEFKTRETSSLNEDIIIGHKYLLVPQRDPNKSYVDIQNMSIQSERSTPGSSLSAVLRPVEISIKVAPPISREIPTLKRTRHESPILVVDDVESDDSDDTIIVD